jgi:XTP/dITP diphosphohydrolase
MMRSDSCYPQSRSPVAAKLLLASSNPGKLKEFRVLALDAPLSLELELFPGFDAIPAFDESAPTFAENSLGKALYYAQHTNDCVLADDSGLVVPSLDGRPGVHSARYAGANATSEQRIAKLLGEMRGKAGSDREAHFVCALSLVHKEQALAVITARTDGAILEAVRGKGGFGYDPVFYFPPLQKTFAELTAEEKNQHSHRGKAFRRMLAALPDVL